MLKTTADENPGTWPQRLATVMAAYRMTVHKTTGVTPNMAMLGRGNDASGIDCSTAGRTAFYYCAVC